MKARDKRENLKIGSFFAVKKGRSANKKSKRDMILGVFGKSTALENFENSKKGKAAERNSKSATAENRNRNKSLTAV